MKRYDGVLYITAVLLLAGCSSHTEVPPEGGALPIAKTAQSGSTKARLYDQYREWKGVRYRMGGLSKKGIDCSGFAYMTYKSRFGIELPRSTLSQAEVGTPVKKSQLRTGDLVFFKTSSRVRHVGIYLEDGKFLHASTSKGVIISRLDNLYWKSRYWKAKRVR